MLAAAKLALKKGAKAARKGAKSSAKGAKSSAKKARAKANRMNPTAIMDAAKAKAQASGMDPTAMMDIAKAKAKEFGMDPTAMMDSATEAMQNPEGAKKMAMEAAMKAANAAGLSPEAATVMANKAANAVGLTGKTPPSSENADAVAQGISPDMAVAEAPGVNPVLYLLLLNLFVRIILCSRISKKTKHSQKDHAYSTLGVAFISLLLFIFIYKYLPNTTNPSTNKGKQTNMFHDALLFILFILVILYDAILPLYLKSTNETKMTTQEKRMAIWRVMFFAGISCIIFNEIIKISKYTPNINFMTTVGITGILGVLTTICVTIINAGNDEPEDKTAKFLLKDIKGFYMITLVSYFIFILGSEYYISKL
jgi:hypothetical protein